ncbi:MAG: type II toxin-antitoxin system VapC family toxin [bacterium]
MVAYADTSFLVSLYGQDTKSAPAQAVAATFKAPLAFTPLLRHEARNAIRLALFRKELTPIECQEILAAIEADTKTGALVETPVAWAEVYTEAEALSAAHTEKLGTRALDVLHVAMAAALGIKDFYTFDTRQKALALKAGMKVKP